MNIFDSGIGSPALVAIFCFILNLLVLRLTILNIMANIRRINASNEAIEEMKRTAFSMGGFGFPPNLELIIEDFGWVSHSVDGVNKNTACPVVTLQGLTEIIYIRSLIKERIDYQGQIVPITGTFNLKVRELLGRTWGEVFEALTPYKGKKLKTLRKTYMGINRNGDVQTISYNEYDLVE